MFMFWQEAHRKLFEEFSLNITFVVVAIGENDFSLSELNGIACNANNVITTTMANLKFKASNVMDKFCAGK